MFAYGADVEVERNDLSLPWCVFAGLPCGQRFEWVAWSAVELWVAR